MSLHLDLSLPKASPARCESLRHELQLLPVPSGEVWSLAIQETADEDSWLLLARGAVAKSGISPDWSPLAIEGDAETLRCTYASVVTGIERQAGFIGRRLERLLYSRSLRVSSADRFIPRSAEGAQSRDPR